MVKILVVEDAPEQRHLLEVGLRQAGHLAVGVASGTEALRVLAERGAPHVAMLDVLMPGMTGLQLHAEMRRKPRLAAVPVIFLSARVQREDVAAAQAVGALYLTKPIIMSAVLRAIDRVLDDGAAREPATTETGRCSAGGDPAQRRRVSRDRDIRLRLLDLGWSGADDDHSQLLRGILKEFNATGGRTLAQLEDAVRRECVEEVEQNAHLLKGSAANIGATELARLLDAVEQRSRGGRLPPMADLRVVRDELSAVNRAAAAAVAISDSHSAWAADPASLETSW